jgi:hypothetical protein
MVVNFRIREIKEVHVRVMDYILNMQCSRAYFFYPHKSWMPLNAIAFCLKPIFSPVLCGFDDNFVASFTSFENVGYVFMGSFQLQLRSLWVFFSEGIRSD